MHRFFFRLSAAGCFVFSCLVYAYYDVVASLFFMLAAMFLLMFAYIDGDS